MNAKPIWQSKTIWVNGLTLAAGVLSLVAGSDLIAAFPRAAAAVVTTLGVVNVALRFVTTTPIAS